VVVSPSVTVTSGPASASGARFDGVGVAVGSAATEISVRAKSLIPTECVPVVSNVVSNTSVSLSPGASSTTRSATTSPSTWWATV
jgi:hypothetical protein